MVVVLRRLSLKGESSLLSEQPQSSSGFMAYTPSGQQSGISSWLVKLSFRMLPSRT
jgi:hypothetical protein